MIGKQRRRDFLKTGFILGTGMAVGPADSIFARNHEDQDMSVFDAIKKRRSVRKFKPTPVPEDHLRRILEAANQASSPRNRQAWLFLVIQNRDTLNRIKEACIQNTGEENRAYFEDYLSAPVYVVVLADTNTRNPVNDFTAGALAAQNLMLAARALGYGTVYCVNSIPENILIKVLNIPDRYKYVCIAPIGVPDAWPKVKAKKRLEDVVVYEKILQNQED